MGGFPPPTKLLQFGMPVRAMRKRLTWICSNLPLLYRPFRPKVALRQIHICPTSLSFPSTSSKEIRVSPRLPPLLMDLIISIPSSIMGPHPLILMSIVCRYLHLPRRSFHLRGFNTAMLLTPLRWVPMHNWRLVNQCHNFMSIKGPRNRRIYANTLLEHHSL